MTRETSVCPFCNAAAAAVLQNTLTYAVPDKFPVTQGHLLLIPFRHVESYFDTTPAEREALLELLDRAKALTDEKFAPDGYNIGVNVGAAAGQTVAHVHVHLIPRYRGDVARPRGGVRGVIPAKQSY
jgi:diadenosine tetraphosphate (Ap4A) HIT family hydrolase